MCICIYREKQVSCSAIYNLAAATPSVLHDLGLHCAVPAAAAAVAVPAAAARLRETYMYHMLGQMLFFLAWGGLPYFVWGFVIRVLFTMHMTW
jgi:hypothetical protein